ncbi:MAG: carboxypeptidase regulatory-like domain-containing protein [Acidobacteriia bacterium]|nr:carboxypeptidase regulatory-like domain-containing protein [Terriglobia bacterium]
MSRRTSLFVLFLFLCASAFAQTTSLTGTVTDPSGAVIPGANISIVNAQTGAERNAASDNQGRYTMALVTPGTYKLTAKASGFSDVVIEKVELLVSQPATVAVVFEKVGSTTTTVQVEAAATQINTTDASLGNAISNTAIQEVPMFARNVAGLLAMQPGVTSFSSFGNQATGALPNSRDGSVNGGKPDQSNITLDGADVNDQNSRAAFTSVLRVTLDSVEEFRSTTTNGDAATGRGSGADVTLVTKSGTNELHGSLYEYRRGTETSANTFFNNAAGVPVAPLLINVFGGTIGGPVKKNRVFYFLNYEGRRDRSSSQVSRTVPTDSLKQGIVKYKDANGVTQSIGGAALAGVDPGGKGIDAAALSDLAKFPTGNNPSVGDGLNTIGYLFNAPSPTDQNTYIAKVDYRLDDAGKHSIFLRGNLQNDSTYGTPQFPGQPANQVFLANSKGLAAGYTGVLTPNLVNTFRYGFTRAGNQQTGVLSGTYAYFRGFDTLYGTTTGLTHIIPVHTIGDDLSWNKGAHNIRFGGVVRLVSNNSQDFANSFSHTSSNPSWLTGSGNDLTGSLSISTGTLNSYEYATAALLGIQSQGTGSYNYLVNGTVLPPGAPVARDFVNHEGEFYVQDTWKATRNLTITAGLRYSLSPAVFEANGQQASTTVPIGDFMSKREILANQGLSQAGAGPITFIPVDAPNARGMYPFHKNWAPRLGLAYSPKAESGISKWLFGGPGKTSIRAGAGMYYDLIGQPLAQTFSSSQFGLSSRLNSPPNVLGSANAPRYSGFYTPPTSLIPASPGGGLPTTGLTYPDLFAITNSIDDNLKNPYTMNLDFSVGRELGKGYFIQASYVGRLSRHSLIQRDLAEPTNLVDPKSGQTYFQAMTQLMTLMDIQGVTVPNLPKIPFFENMWATAAGSNPVLGPLTATQVWGLDYRGYTNGSTRIGANSNAGDATNTLNNADNASNCNPGKTLFSSGGRVNAMACGVQGPWMMFNPQFSALSAWSSIGSGAYHALQITTRKRFSNGLQFDLNYTFSKSIDLASAQESGSSASAGGASFSGIIINTWNPSLQRAVSNYDTTHQVNAFVSYSLPFGRGQKFGSNMNKILDAFVGGWQISAIYRQTSGLPFNITDGARWATNWEISSNGVPNGQPIPQVVSTGTATGVKGPYLWANPAAAFASFREAFAGEAGARNVLRGDGLFNIDTGVYKVFTMPYSEKHKLQFRWESYNLTNSVRFDPATASTNLLSQPTFGQLQPTLAEPNGLISPRQMQFALRYIW